MKRLISLITVLICLLSFNFSFADEVKDKTHQLNDKKDKISDIKDKISTIEDKQESTEKEMDKLDQEITSVQNEISDLDSKIELMDKEIIKSKKEVEKINDQIKAQNDLYEDRVRAMYMNGPAGYIDIILSAQSFVDLLTRADMVKRVVEYDKNILLNMSKMHKEEEEKKNKLTNQQNELVDLKNELDTKRKQLVKASDEKQKYYDKLDDNIDSYKKMLSDEERASRELEQEIKKLQREQERREQERLEQEKREQEEREKQENANKQNANNNNSNNGHASNNVGSPSVVKGGIVRASDIGYTPRITCPYGMRIHPVLNIWRMHTGVDLGVPSGTPIYSMDEGTVIIARYSGAYGNYVVVDHGGGITTLYAHASRLLVSAGQKVKKGQMIMKSGNTGYSTGAHLHFEVRKNGGHIDPTPYIKIGK